VEVFASADAVFVGTVSHDGFYSASDRRLEPLRRLLGLASAPPTYQPYAVVSVSQAWKGVQRSPVRLMYDNSTCDFPFMAGQKYLIFAWAAEDGLVTHLCSGTGGINYHGAALAYLQTQPTVFVSQPGAGWLETGLAACAGVAVLLFVSALALRRRARRPAHSHEV